MKKARLRTVENANHNRFVVETYNELSKQWDLYVSYPYSHEKTKGGIAINRLAYYDLPIIIRQLMKKGYKIIDETTDKKIIPIK